MNLPARHLYTVTKILLRKFGFVKLKLFVLTSKYHADFTDGKRWKLTSGDTGILPCMVCIQFLGLGAPTSNSPALKKWWISSPPNSLKDLHICGKDVTQHFHVQVWPNTQMVYLNFSRDWLRAGDWVRSRKLWKSGLVPLTPLQHRGTRYIPFFFSRV